MLQHRIHAVVIATALAAAAVAGVFALSAGGTPARKSAQASGVSVHLDPNVARRASSLVVSADGRAAADGRMPKSAVLSVQRGFRVDARSRSARCTPRQAQSSACPEASRIGSGSAVVTARGALVPGGAQDFTAKISLFLAAPVPSSDVAGVVVDVKEPVTGQGGVVTGRIVRRASGPYGYELRFDRFPTTSAPPAGITVKLKRLDLRAGARRTTTRFVTVGRGTRRHRVRRRVTYSLITNPSSCAGSWRGHATLTFEAGAPVEADVSTPCRAR